MKKLFLFVLSVVISIQLSAQAKYVFYFIADGTGADMVNLTQYYLSAVDGQIGTTPLVFSNFPVCNVATTFSANNPVTDSAASGTALATGQKTNNGFLGVTPDKNKCESIAEVAKKNGAKVGIMTSVGANHATPGAFFGHQPSRNMYDQIIGDMIADDFDFYAGSTLIRNSDKNERVYGDDPTAPFLEAGYSLVHSNDDFKQCCSTASKILFLPEGKYSISGAWDRKSNPASEAVTITDFVTDAIEFFTVDKCRKGFFIMCEGGEVDHFTHANDAAGAVGEVLDFAEAVNVAYQFYLRHPKETAIIVTADHDTGGPGLNLKSTNLAGLKYQKHSQSLITKLLKAKMQAKGAEPLTWEEVKEFLADETGLWKEIKVSKEDTQYLKDIYDQTIAVKQTGDVSDSFGYNHNAEIVSKAVAVSNRLCGVVWGTRSHSAAYTPVYYIGPKQEIFSSRMDNSYFFDKILAVTKWQK